MTLTKPIVWLILLMFVFTILSALTITIAVQTQVSNHAAVRPLTSSPPPPPTVADTTAAQNPHGFQLLISYVDTGFEPREATIQSGDTVRFTNNSTKQLWIAAGGGSGVVYPPIASGCGSSALDSCRPLNPGEYWEFTFTAKGTWSFVNNVNKANVGIVQVE